MRRIALVAGVVAVLAALVPTVALAADPPPNEGPDDAIPLANPGAYEQSTSGASPTPEAPMSCVGGVGYTVWFTVDATNSSILLSTSGSNFDTVMATYAADASGLTELSCNDEAGFGGISEIQVPAGTGVVYVQVGGFYSDHGFLRVASGSSAILDAVDVTGLPFEDTARTELDRPALLTSCYLDANGPVYEYSPAEDQRLTIVAERTDSGYSTVALAVTGTAGGDGGACDSSYDRPVTLVVDAVAGEPLRFQASTWSERDISIAIDVTTPPDNDERSGATPIIDGDVVHQSTIGATRGPDEPLRCGADRSVWFRYDASRNTNLVLDTRDSWFDTVVAAYVEVDGELERVACNDDVGYEETSLVGLPVEAGTTYWIQVGGFMGEVGDLVLEVDETDVWTEQGVILAGRANAGTKNGTLRYCVTSRFAPSFCDGYLI